MGTPSLAEGHDPRVLLDRAAAGPHSMLPTSRCPADRATPVPDGHRGCDDAVEIARLLGSVLGG